eukprot:gene10988-7632_t
MLPFSFSFSLCFYVQSFACTGAMHSSSRRAEDEEGGGKHPTKEKKKEKEREKPLNMEADRHTTTAKLQQAKDTPGKTLSSDCTLTHSRPCYRSLSAYVFFDRSIENIINNKTTAEGRGKRRTASCVPLILFFVLVHSLKNIFYFIVFINLFFHMWCRRRCAAHFGAAAASAASPALLASRCPKSTGATEGIPTLSFLATPTTLLDKVDQTLAVSQKLLDLIPASKDPQEQHDMIDTTSNILCLLLDPAEFVRQIHPSDAYKNGALEAFQRGHQFMSEANSRRDLYEVIRRLDSPEVYAQLDEESVKNVIQLRRDMEGNGIHLGDRERDIVTRMNINVEELSMKYLMEQQNPAAANAILQELLKDRYELAQFLGFESYAEKQLRGTMLEKQEKVWAFLCNIAYKYREAAEKELEVIRKSCGGRRGAVTEEERAHYASLIRHAAEPEGLSKYFSVANCIRGIECLCSEVFGVRLEQVPFAATEVFAANARKYHVRDEDGQFLGVILLDLYMNPAKYCQAGHLTLQLGCRPHQGVLRQIGVEMPARQYPMVALTCNVNASSASKPDDEHTLMDPHEVTTLFHEFGHAMHTIFGQTKVQNLAGTRSSIDYVETFSQLFELFLTSHDFLRLWACHADTRQPISVDLVEKRNSASRMFAHLDRLDQVLLSAVDQALHGKQPMTVFFPTSSTSGSGKEGTLVLSHRSLGPTGNVCDKATLQLPEALVEVVRPFAVGIPSTNSVMHTLSTEHIAGYPGGYYGYLYSGTVARRIWEKKFASNPLSRTAGRELVQKVMAHGAACDPVKTIEAYLGDRLEDVPTWA